ncbi:MAG: DUF5110 domain-containing protein [Chloroflexi bacterium]|nr:DUF5110 domain-containing protein [Chloroflexota bacterium]
MPDVLPQFKVPFRAKAHDDATVIFKQARFTLLTTRLIRMEYSSTGGFDDRPTQTFWYREQPVPAFEVKQADDQIEIITEHLHLVYKPAEPHFELNITLRESGIIWHYGATDRGNLRGTVRTLDEVNGYTTLEPGLISVDGWVVVDDTDSLAFDEDAWLEPRASPRSYEDLYFFGYGQDYQAALHDFALVAGPMPLLPRWSLGNWWSRYWEYTQDELKAGVEGFQAADIPLSVCIIDMDWHLTDTGGYGSGWTGYTWNRALFPDPDGFIAWLHEQGVRTALNLHPADGVQPHEEQYEAFARFMGVDPASKEPIPFDLVDLQFAQAYFEHLHHPFEEQGVDFWWIDWQQGELSNLPGLDPLWLLNHTHSLDRARDGSRRPFLFSRWGGLGNHRYPVGFSGDNFITWESLQFQPYFTATAANVAYGWWSHDIGGHQRGEDDPELYVRWIQFGALNPILRIHSGKNGFMDRRPWAYDAGTLAYIRDAMQFRHSLIPYLYTMAWRNHHEHVLPFRPMVHDYPEHEAAHYCPDQYAIGSELIAAPHIHAVDPEIGMSRQVVWLPPGQWTHFFTGELYEGNTWHALYGDMGDMPLFARAGAIVPLAPQTGWGGIENPKALDLHLFAGADNRFDLYEDDGVSMAYQDGAYAITPIEIKAGDEQTIVNVGPVQGDGRLIPDPRVYTLIVYGLAEPANLALEVDGTVLETGHDYDPASGTLTIGPITLTSGQELITTITASAPSDRDNRWDRVQRMLRHFKMPLMDKQPVSDVVALALHDIKQLAQAKPMLSDAQLRALIEVVAGVGMHVVSHIAKQPLLVIWNNHEQAGLTYQLSAITTKNVWAVRVDADVWLSEQGGVPRFKGFAPGQPFDKSVQDRSFVRWSLDMNYFGIAPHSIREEQ